MSKQNTFCEVFVAGSDKQRDATSFAVGIGTLWHHLSGTCCLMSFLVSDNGFSQIFYNCSNEDEIFYWHN